MNQPQTIFFIRVDILAILFIGAAYLSACKQYSTENRSICVQEDPLILPEATAEEINSKIKVLLTPTGFIHSAAQPVAAFVLGLEKKGWKIVDSESVAKTADPAFNIKNALALSKAPDIVAFYPISGDKETNLFEKWGSLPLALFTKILIVENLDSNGAINAAKYFVNWGDAVLVKDPTLFTQTIAPQKILCFPFYQPKEALEEGQIINLRIEQLDRLASRIHKLYRGN